MNAVGSSPENTFEKGFITVSEKAKFNETVQKIMSVLVDACPKYVPVNATSLGLVGGEYVDGDFKSSADEDYLRECRVWLLNEGLIRGEDNCVATLKGLEFFDALPECFKKK